MDQVSIRYTYHHFPLQDPPKFTQIWILGLKTNYLATLPKRRKDRRKSWSEKNSGRKKLDSVLLAKRRLSETRGLTGWLDWRPSNLEWMYEYGVHPFLKFHFANWRHAGLNIMILVCFSWIILTQNVGIHTYKK
jgi:hypothetical protein